MVEKLRYLKIELYLTDFISKESVHIPGVVKQGHVGGSQELVVDQVLVQHLCLVHNVLVGGQQVHGVGHCRRKHIPK